MNIAVENLSNLGRPVSNKVQLLKSFASEPSLSHPQLPNFSPFSTLASTVSPPSRCFSGMCEKKVSFVLINLIFQRNKGSCMTCGDCAFVQPLLNFPSVLCLCCFVLFRFVLLF